MTRCYTELVRLPTMLERYNYLKLGAQVGTATFGFDRYLNQVFYRSAVWREVRRKVVLRDQGCDLGIDVYPIGGKILVHHMNPITEKDIINEEPWIVDPEFLITISHQTHEAVHFGDVRLLPKDPIERRPNDTCPWKSAT